MARKNSSKAQPDNAALPKKERQKQEMDELDNILGEFGLEPREEEVKQSSNEGKKQTRNGSKGPKTSKKEIFQNVRAEINARQEKSKKTKAKNQYK